MNIPDNISKIAAIISKDWKNVNYAAKPYLEAMFSLQTLSDSCLHDDASDVINHFLTNANSWHGETAREVKKKLKTFVN